MQASEPQGLPADARCLLHEGQWLSVARKGEGGGTKGAAQSAASSPFERVTRRETPGARQALPPRRPATGRKDPGPTTAPGPHNGTWSPRAPSSGEGAWKNKTSSQVAARTFAAAKQDFETRLLTRSLVFAARAFRFAFRARKRTRSSGGMAWHIRYAYPDAVLIYTC